MLDENGDLTFIDRLKDIIISGGLNISAAEVERVITEVDGIDEVAVIAAHDGVRAGICMMPVPTLILLVRASTHDAVLTASPPQASLVQADS